MGWRGRIAFVVVWIAAVAGVAPSRADVVVVPPRPGQVGLAVQGSYGTLLQSGQLGESFGSGPGLSIRLRYRMRYERGFGLSFESQSFDTRTNAIQRDVFGTPVPADSAIAPTRLTLGLYGIDFYQMFGTRTRTTKMLSVSAGVARLSRNLNDGETDFPGDGVFVSGGAGLERFVWQSWGYDLTGRYYAVFREGQVNHNFQIALGLVFYASL